MNQAIYLHKTDVMKRIQHLVSHGYLHYIQGEIAPKKLEAFILKMSDRYEIQRTAQQRWRAKGKGICSTELVLLASDPVKFWILATEGEGLVHQLESLSDARNKAARLEITGYELVRVPKKDGKPSWTWRMTSENYEAWQERIKSAVRRFNDDLVRQALWSLKRVPGFSESRRQAFKLQAFAKAQWKRTQKGKWPYENIFVGYHGKFKAAKTVEAREFAQKASSFLKKKTLQTRLSQL